MLHLPDHGPHSTLLLGGARSGKSRVGEALVTGALVTGSGDKPLYIATAEARDEEMSERIEHHQARRGSEWAIIEEPIALADVLRENVTSEHIVLVDCLTLWLSNLMEKEKSIPLAVDDLIDALRSTQGRIVMISNEVGQGIVPDNALARRFRDEAGFMHQRIAATVDQVAFIVAGLPLMLKESATPR